MSERDVLQRARVLLVGIGGLGCPAAIALAQAGVGTIGIADDDVVERTNLHRQILFGDEDVGRAKVEAAAAALARMTPSLRVEAHGSRLLPHNAVELVSRYDVVIEGSDNFPTKFLAADAARIARRPIVHGAAIRWHGTAFAVGPADGPCYRCLFEDIPGGSAQQNCATAGVVGPVVGIVAAVQADLAIEILRGRGVFGTLVTFDGKALTSRRRTIARRKDCSLCSDGGALARIEPSRYIAAAGC